MHVVLLLFEALSGQKVNFYKSELVGVNVSDFWLSEASKVMNCRVGRLPFVYLGLPIGSDARWLKDSLMHRTKSRLSSWKFMNLLLGTVLFSRSLSCHLSLLCLFLLQGSLMYHFLY